MSLRRVLIFHLLAACVPPSAVAQSRMPGVDLECEKSFIAANRQCSEKADVEMKACMQRRLSAGCATQVAAPAHVPRSAECKAEARAMAEPCARDVMQGSGSCVRAQLDAQCREQVNKFLGPAPVK